MAIARLLVAGIMVASGIVLGTFAALGYLDPNWTQNQLAAASKREPPADPKSAINTFRRTRFVANETEAPSQPKPQPPVVKAPAKPTPRAAETASVEQKHIVKTSATKKPAKQPVQAQQAAAVQWPWNLFGN
jgi:hypothetical protein